jgi:Flp pilus assembly protein TadG
LPDTGVGHAATTATARRRGRRLRLRPSLDRRGQSLVEFAVVLPVMLAIGGVLIDAARLYQVWTTLESATRDAAQYLATSAKDTSSPDYTWAGEDADSKAAYILSVATQYPVARSVSADALASCDVPQVTTTYTQDTSAASGGSVANPLSTATVTVCIPFRTLFAYPFLTTNGAFLLRTERTMSVLMGR